MTSQQVRISRAWWVTVLIIVGLAAGYYFGWPYVGAYWKNTAFKGILKSYARTCAQEGQEKCMAEIRAKALADLAIDLGGEDVVPTLITTNKVVFKVSYRLKLEYPFTGTMFGSGKDRYMRQRFTHDTKLSGY